MTLPEYRPDPAFLAEAAGLTKRFPLEGAFFPGGPTVTALDEVCLGVRPGSTLGLVGESGAGKTTLGRLLAALLKPDGGAVFFEGRDINRLDRRERRDLRRRIQILFQDPYSSLDPRMTVYEIVGEGLRNFKLVRNRRESRDRVAALAERCGIPADQCSRYPHQFSGGQRQRIGIARALALNPRFIVCDEPVSALDVSIRAQIINLLMDLREQAALTYLLVSHDLRTVECISNEAAVLYQGRIVERGPTADVFRSPRHPYTQALASAVPAFPGEERAPGGRILLPEEASPPENPSQGCSFKGRCNRALDICAGERPRLKECSPGHFTACHNA